MPRKFWWIAMAALVTEVESADLHLYGPLGTVIEVRPNLPTEFPVITNAVPFQESFEAYGNNTPISGHRGWFGAEYDFSTATNAALPASVTVFPIQTNHTRYVALNAQGDFLVNVITGNQQHVWLDMLVSFVPGDRMPTDKVSQFMLWLNDWTSLSTNLCVYARLPGANTNGFLASSFHVESAPYGDPPSRFYRLSVHLAYLSAPTGACFAVYLRDAEEVLKRGE